MPKITLTCIQCGKSFTDDPCKAHRKYCGRRCMALHQRAAGTFRPKNWDFMIGNKFGVGHTPANVFKKGHVPWTAGQKGIRLSPATEFKKGHRHALALPVGTIRRREPSGKSRDYIKVAEPHVWRAVSTVVWEQHHGPIPQGWFVHHIDGDMLNDSIENLACMSPSEHTRLHATRRWAERKAAAVTSSGR